MFDQIVSTSSLRWFFIQTINVTIKVWYDRINVPEGTDIYKTSVSLRCIICNYYFINVNFIFELKACDGCHDLMQKALSFNELGITSFKRQIIEFFLDKHEAINIGKRKWIILKIENINFFLA